MTFKQLHEASGMSLTAFCKYFNLAYRTAQHWEAGTRSCPDYLLDLMEYKLKNEGMITMRKFYVTLSDNTGNEHYLLVTEDIEKAKARAKDEDYYIARDKRKGDFVEIRDYIEDIEDDSCDCFDYATIDF